MSYFVENINLSTVMGSYQRQLYLKGLHFRGPVVQSTANPGFKFHHNKSLVIKGLFNEHFP